jgi:hypothetical protein
MSIPLELKTPSLLHTKTTHGVNNAQSMVGCVERLDNPVTDVCHEMSTSECIIY